MSKGFWSAIGEFIENAAEAVEANETVVDRMFTYDDDDNSHLQVLLKYKSGRSELVTYVRENLIRPASVDTTPIDRKPRECRSSTPADACEDRNCWHHRDVPGNQRSPLFYRF